MLTMRLSLLNMRGAGRFVVAMLVDSLGSGLFVPFSLLYFHTVADLPLLTVGLVLTIASILSLPMTLVSGRIVDQVGSRRVLIISELLLATGFFSYLLVRSIPALFAAALLATAGDRIFWVAQPTVISELASANKQDHWYGLIGSVRMIGLALGGFLAGFIISFHSIIGYKVLAGADALSFLIVLALFLPYWRERKHHPIEKLPGPGPSYKAILCDRPFLGVILSNVSFILCVFMLTIALPTYTIQALQAPGWIVGIVLALNTGLMAGGQLLFVRLLEPYRRTRILMIAGLIWCGSSGLLILALWTPQFLLIPFLIAIVCVYTVAELMHAPTANALVAQAGPVALRGRYIAAYQLSWGIGIALTPALFTLLFSLGPALPWIVLAGLTLISALVIRWLERWLPAQAVRY